MCLSRGTLCVACFVYMRQASINISCDTCATIGVHGADDQFAPHNQPQRPSFLVSEAHEHVHVLRSRETLGFWGFLGLTEFNCVPFSGNFGFFGFFGFEAPYSKLELRFLGNNWSAWSR